MSVLTEVLKLFKYDPATDGDMTFNIGQCMNDNWDKLDAAILLAIAAAGAYNPEESYAVGDYCTNKGKLHKCSTAITTGETWTEAHWTTTTVAAELAELSSQLSNKQDLIWLGIAEMDADLNDLKQIGTTAIHGTSKNIPPDVIPGNWGLLTVSANSKNGQVGCTQHLSIMVTEGYFPQIYERNWNGLNWSKWARIATATPPQVFDLPLAEEMQPLPDFGSNKYWKNQFNEVTLTLSVTKTDMNTNDIENSSLLATLPAGFRPATIVSGAAFVDRGAESVVYPACIVIYPDGSVIMNQSNGVSCSMVIASMSFLAAG